jgi:hypothetical protein
MQRTVVELIPPFRRYLGTTRAVVLTEPMYSRQRRYQLILPIIPRSPPHVGTHDLLLSRDVLNALGMHARSGLLPIPLVQSIWHEEDVVRETEHVLDETILNEIDRRLCAYFSLPETDAED